MPSPNAIAALPSTARFQLSAVNSRLFCSNPFSFTHFRKNASVNPLDSHSFKTKDLKPFRFTHFQKKVGGTPAFPLDALLQSPVTSVVCESRLCRDRRFWVLSTVNSG